MNAPHLLDLTLSTPAENLACDEALLEACELGQCPGGGVLRFWEACASFVVLGYANKVREEVDVAACEQRGIPILRRCSGGGSVLQGPGCLSYSLLLPLTGHPALAGITETNCYIMERHREALEPLLGPAVAVRGYTDLALGDLKFSGNSQRRKRHWLLFHGTFLLAFDIALVQALFHPPPRQPDYRRNRSHSEFLTQLHLPAESIKGVLRNAWNAHRPLEDIPRPQIQELAREKYAQSEWNFRW